MLNQTIDSQIDFKEKQSSHAEQNQQLMSQLNKAKQNFDQLNQNYQNQKINLIQIKSNFKYQNEDIQLLNKTINKLNLTQNEQNQQLKDQLIQESFDSQQRYENELRTQLDALKTDFKDRLKEDKLQCNQDIQLIAEKFTHLNQKHQSQDEEILQLKSQLNQAITNQNDLKDKFEKQSDNNVRFNSLFKNINEEIQTLTKAIDLINLNQSEEISQLNELKKAIASHIDLQTEYENELKSQLEAIQLDFQGKLNEEKSKRIEDSKYRNEKAREIIKRIERFDQEIHLLNIITNNYDLLQKNYQDHIKIKIAKQRSEFENKNKQLHQQCIELVRKPRVSGEVDKKLTERWRWLTKWMWWLNDPICSVAVLDDQSIASGDLEGNIKIWNSLDGSLIRTISSNNSARITSMVVMNDGRLVSGGYDDTITIWNATSGQSLLTLKGHTENVNCLVVLNENEIASGSGDNTTIIWDANTGEQLKLLSGHIDSVRSLATLENNRLASASSDKTIKIWNLNNGEEIKTLKSSSVYSLLALPDDRLASGSKSGLIRIWDIQSGTIVHQLKGHTDFVKSLILLKDELTMASASADKTIILWDIKTGKLIKTLEEHTDSVFSLAVLEDGRLVSGSHDESVIIWK